MPTLQSFTSPLTPSPPSPPSHRRTALDVGAGIGRVTRHVLLPLFDDVVLLEPVGHFIAEAQRSVKASEWRDLPVVASHGQVSGEDGAAERKEMQRRIEEGRKGRGKRVWMVKGGLQGFDPAFPVRKGESAGVYGEVRGEGQVGEKGTFGEEEREVAYDA